MDKEIKILFAMGCITALEVVNMFTVKLDGAVFSLVIGAISGLGGFIIGKKNK